MSLTDRDKKIVLALVPVLVIGAYWFLLLAPKRAEAERLGTELGQVEQTRDDALARVAALEGSRRDYASDYATVVRLGKAVPSTVDMPSLLVQLDEAAEGTDIRFGKITAGTRAAAPAPPAPPATGSTPPAAPAGNAAAGGAPAQTAPGQATEAAGETVATVNGSTTSPTGAVPAPGLETLPLTFEFSGGFFDLADFFHEMKRFVYLANERVEVDGRLMTIDGFTFDSASFPTIKAEVQATVYLSPESQGVTAGGTPTGPATTTVGSGQAAPAPAPAPTSVPPASSAAPAPTSVGVQ